MQLLLSDFLKVAAARHSSQREKILQLLQTGCFVSTASLRLFSYQYNARLYELRRGRHDGICYHIVKERDELGRCGFRMVEE